MARLGMLTYVLNETASESKPPVLYSSSLEEQETIMAVRTAAGKYIFIVFDF